MNETIKQLAAKWSNEVFRNHYPVERGIELALVEYEALNGPPVTSASTESLITKYGDELARKWRAPTEQILRQMVSELQGSKKVVATPEGMPDHAVMRAKWFELCALDPTEILQNWSGFSDWLYNDYFLPLQKPREEKLLRESQEEIAFLKRMLIRAHCGCLAMYCIVHGAYSHKDWLKVESRILGRCPIPSSPEKPKVKPMEIFSGPQSQGLWDAINNAKNVDDLRMALYTVVCRIQELESKVDKARPEVKEGE